MSADLAAYTADPAGLDRLDEGAVTALLERGKSWLDMAVARGVEVNELVNYKGEAAVLRELVTQKELGKDAELAATELIRRAERGIGLAIRKGQEAGEIRRTGERTVIANQHGPAAQVDNTSSKPGPTDFGVSFDELRGNGAGIYHLTDDVTDEQFDAGIAEAKAEGNLSRANVVRKVTGREKPKGKRPQVLRRTRRIDSRRVIAATVDTAAANTLTKDLLAEIDMSELETHDLEEWISSLSESIRALTSLKTTLKKELSQRG